MWRVQAQTVPIANVLVTGCYILSLKVAAELSIGAAGIDPVTVATRNLLSRTNSNWSGFEEIKRHESVPISLVLFGIDVAVMMNLSVHRTLCLGLC